MTDFKNIVMRYRLIAPERYQKNNKIKPVLEKNASEITEDWLQQKNEEGYNIYYFPNGPKKNIHHNLNAKDVEEFNWVFIDMDLKDGVYNKKSDFIQVLKKFPLKPTKTIDSGHGIHVYWRVLDLDRLSYMQLQKALISEFKTDKSIWTITQLMRVEGYFNTKYDDKPLCQKIDDEDLCGNNSYTISDFWDYLDPISKKDQEDIDQHINKYIHGIELTPLKLNITPLPEEFEKLLENNKELSDLFFNPKDRSIADMKIANILQIQGFEKDEAINILLHTSKGSERGEAYVVPLINKVYSSPLDILNPEREELIKLASVDKYYDTLALENKRYKIEQENKKIKEAKEADSLQNAYTLHGVEESIYNYYIEELEKQFLESSKSMPFISDRLSKVVPFYGNQFILIGGQTGRGKTTTSANIILPLLQAGKKIAMISTEEKSENIIYKVACLKNNFNFSDRASWIKNPEKKEQLFNEIKQLTTNGSMKFYDSYTYGLDIKTGTKIKPPEMTTIEGIEMALRDIEEAKVYDVVILDYISKVGASTKSYGSSEWELIYKLAVKCEEWAKRNNIPFVAFTQLKEPIKGAESFASRLPGSKRLLNLVTSAIEIETNWEAKTTTFISHKNRETGLLFRKTVKYDKGRYIDFPIESDTEEPEIL